MGMFSDLLKRASNFVEKQKGLWDHTAWQNFLSDMQKKGVKLTDEMQNYLGQVMESMKKFYSSSVTKDFGKGISEAMSNVSDQTAKYIEKTKGVWDHAGWEKYVKDVQNKGVKLTDDTISFVGDILESAKRLYTSLPFTEAKPSEKKPPKKKTTVKAKTPSKTVSKPKAKKAAKTTEAAKKPVKKTSTEKSTPKKPKTTKPKTTTKAVKEKKAEEPNPLLSIGAEVSKLKEEIQKEEESRLKTTTKKSVKKTT